MLQTDNSGSQPIFTQTLQTLQQNLNILREREAKYAGDAPTALLNQIRDHEQAIALTRQAQRGEISEAEWRETLRPLLVDIPDKQPAPLSPRRRGGYAIAGVVLGLAANVALNLFSSGLEQQFFGQGFTVQALWSLGLFALVGGLLGLWLSGPAKVPASAVLPVESAKPVTVTRLRALFAFIKLRGKGISLSDILLIGAKLDIDTRSDDDSPDH